MYAPESNKTDISKMP
jgi:hypothetical protein